ncbi:MAG: histidine kinase, partial [Candidatus Competibacter sp.]
LLGQLESRRSLDLLVAAADRVVLLGPQAWLGHTLGADSDLSESGRYVIGQNVVPPQLQKGLGWIVVLRQDSDTALARARLAHRTVFWTVLLAGLLSAIAAIFVTRDLTSGLSALADQAQAVRQGAPEQLSVPTGTDEIGRIGTALGDLVSHLQQEKHALATLNAELDARVAERTGRIERLAEEARHAAITRERLRLARELHDTLAHSLMALLTQIRLIRKLRDRLDPEELNAELAQAEEVAASGLAEARAAITQMRHNSVRDEGLGAALQPLLNRFRERSGVNAALHADTQAAGLADERAETVFRIVEEALKNVERHASANTVEIHLQWIESARDDWSPWNPGEPARVHVEIVDDGVGFDPTAPCPGHYGLRGIHEQAELIRASFELYSQPDAGTRIVLEFEA